MKPGKNDPCSCGSGKKYKNCCMGKAVLRSPMPTVAELNQLIALFNTGRLGEVESRARLLVERYPDSGFAWKLLGATMHRLGKDALPALKKAARLLPNDAEAHYNLGVTQKSLGQLDGAVVSYRRALELKPDSADAYNNLGDVLRELGQLDDALACCRRALELKPDFAGAQYNLGNVLRDLDQLDDAVASYRRALEINSDFGEARNNMSYCLLALAQYSEGWQEYEYRWKSFESKQLRPATQLPQWGVQKPSPDDRLLVFEEQGIGDKLQFARYLALAVEQFPGGVSIVIGNPLRKLFCRSFPGVEVLDATPVDQSDWQWQCPLLSLPLAFGTTLDTIPKQIPYLITDLGRVAHWQTKIAALGLPVLTRKIGVVWKTGSFMKNAPLRSLTLQQLAPLLNLTDCIWFSLQKEPDPDKAPWVSSGKLIDWAEEFGDFDETAALAMNMDMIISVDTAMAHLAGGLGRPTWLFNRYASEWRWLRNREDSPWYPTMRIFTQKKAGDWDEVVRRMAAALTAMFTPPAR